MEDTTATTLDHPVTRTGAAARPSRSRRLLGVLAAAAAAGTVWAVAVPVLGADLAVAQSPGGPVGARTVGFGAVVGSALLAGVAGWAVLGLLERWTAHGSRIWRGIAVTVALVSLASPLTMTGGADAAVTLSVLHLVVAAVLVPALAGRPAGSVGR
jgi:hypothetical protein